MELRVWAPKAHEVDVVAVGDQRGEKARGRALHTAVEDERARDDEQLQRRPPASARSTSGKRAARAAAKL